MENKKYMYVNIDSYETQGDSYDEGDGSPYSGYDHTVINIKNIDLCYYAVEGNGWKSHRIKHVDKNVNWENLEECDLYLVLVRYTSGGTFGCTEGYFDPLYISNSYDNVKDYVKNNEEKITKQHTGYFDSLDSIDCELVKFVKNPGSDKKDWWK